eukprot:CAMPEP_0170487010 /NCGR_PEP_ID=MMETSP0208-20121228/5878_1 /TAXON_ID=197538 /ORGANISM="Strombidium inclinatum, Strain S3" /LENGTH=74 /DNA_ID=CAMNT_0010761115 /DNA_START=473 /DNA_END=697 /DNA_ORIENTATION=-
MTDDDLNRAISLYADGNKKQMKAAATNAFMNNKDKIAKAAYDNREVIAQVAYEHKDVIAEVAYENKDAIAEAYI